IQTIAVRPKNGTLAAMLAGFLKTPEPITVPITTAVPMIGPRVRGSGPDRSEVVGFMDLSLSAALVPRKGKADRRGCWWGCPKGMRRDGYCETGWAENVKRAHAPVHALALGGAPWRRGRCTTGTLSAPVKREPTCPADPDTTPLSRPAPSPG